MGVDCLKCINSACCGLVVEVSRDEYKEYKKKGLESKFETHIDTFLNKFPKLKNKREYLKENYNSNYAELNKNKNGFPVIFSWVGRSPGAEAPPPPPRAPPRGRGHPRRAFPRRHGPRTAGGRPRHRRCSARASGPTPPPSRPPRLTPRPSHGPRAPALLAPAAHPVSGQITLDAPALLPRRPRARAIGAPPAPSSRGVARGGRPRVGPGATSRLPPISPTKWKA